MNFCCFDSDVGTIISSIEKKKKTNPIQCLYCSLVGFVISLFVFIAAGFFECWVFYDTIQYKGSP